MLSIIGFYFKSLAPQLMDQLETRSANFHLYGMVNFMVNAPKLENTTMEGLGAQPQKGYLITQKIRRHGAFAAMIAPTIMVRLLF